MESPVVLLVDDEVSIVDALSGSLEDDGYIVKTAPDGIKAIEIIKSQPVDIVFLDIWLPEMDGMQTLNVIKDYDSNIEVVMMTGHGTVNTAVQAVKQGAFDFLEKPFSLDTVIDILKKIKEKQRVSTFSIEQGMLRDKNEKLTILGECSSVLKIKEEISSTLSSSNNILLYGEIGTGKELIARVLNNRMENEDLKLCKFNCALYSPDEIEIELFGCTKNRGDSCARHGFLNENKGKTVFLDSFDLLAVKLQKRLSDYMTASEKNHPRGRVVAATVTDIHKGLKGGTIHKALADCFTTKIHTPSLRTRRGDIPLLLNYFLKYFCSEYALMEKSFDDDSLEVLVNYDWPGNVKELKNLVEKLVVSVPTHNISVHDIPLSVRDEMRYSMAPYYDRYRSLHEAESAWRKNFILYYLKKNNRNIKKTAIKLDVNEKTLDKYIKEYGIVLSKKNSGRKKQQRTLKRSMVLSGTGLH